MNFVLFNSDNVDLSSHHRVVDFIKININLELHSTINCDDGRPSKGNYVDQNGKIIVSGGDRLDEAHRCGAAG